MTHPPVPKSRSALRPMVVGAAVLALTVAAASAALAWWGPSAVASAVSDNARSRAVTSAKEGARVAATSTAVHVGDILNHVRRAAERTARAVRVELAADDGAPRAAEGFSALPDGRGAWRVLDDDGTYVVAPEPTPERSGRLLALARRISPFLRGPVDADDAIVHAAVWIDGVGTVGAAYSPSVAASPARLSAASLGLAGLVGDAPRGAGWLPAGVRLAGERVVSYVVPVYAGPDDRRLAAFVTVDASCSEIAATLARHASRRGAEAAVATSAGEIVVATQGLAERLGVADQDDAVAAALRGVVGADTFRAAASEAADFDGPAAIATAARVPEVGWTVVAAMPPVSRIADSGDGAVGAETASRRQAVGFVALALLFGGAVALGAFALADAFRRRLRPILDGAAAHARGDLDHVIEAAEDDELGELAMALNSTATRLRRNLGRAEESERRLVALIETMGEGFVVADVEDRVVFVNQRFVEMTGRPSSQLVGRYVEELLAPESLARHRAEARRRGEGRPGQYEAAWRTTRGRPARTIVSAMATFDGAGAFCGTSSVVTDVTDRLGAQEERERAEKLRALGELAGGVAHDVNNLLTVMLGNAQLLYMENLSPDARSAVASVEGAAVECGERLRRMMEFTKVRDVGAEAAEVDPNLVVSEATAVVKARRAPEALRRGVDWSVDVRRGSRRVVRGDARELRNALVHLMDNAFDAMPGGGRLVVESADRGADEVALSVRDTGVGMDDYVRGKAFDPFFTTKHPGRCAGLGLAIVAEVARAHGGRVDVQSARDHGSTFTLVLPAREPAPAADEDARPSAAPPRPRVLLADAAGADELRRGLGGLGVHADAVETPGAVLAALEEPDCFNAFVVDLDFGPAGGLELAASARTTRRDAAIVLLAPAGVAVDEAAARAAGVDRVFVRPVDVRDLRAAVFSLLAAGPARGRSDAASASADAATTTQGSVVEIWGAQEGAAPAAAAQAPGGVGPIGNA